MTLLGAIDLGNCILFGADTLVTDGSAAAELPITEKTEKLWKLERMSSIVWGFAGLQYVGHGFRDWIQQRTFSSWKGLVEEAADALAPLNGVALTRMKAAGAEDKYEGTEVLIGGYIDGESRLLTLDCEGGVTPATSPRFFGFAHSVATVAWLVLQQLDESQRPDPETAFRLVMDTSADKVHSLGGPVQYEVATPE